ncbi:MAG: hypothetical protein AAF802_26535 [Planctomycetota bacterium]
MVRPARIGLAVVAFLYFASAVGDVPLWFQSGAPASSGQLGDFFREAGLDDDARWMWSPLFLWDSLFAGTSLAESAFVYRVYLLVGCLWSLLVLAFSIPSIATKFPNRIRGNWVCILLWIWFVGWANRIVLLAGIVEPVLSLSLAAMAIAPLGNDRITWRSHFARRLASIQGTMVMVATTATMLAGNVWWNGTGAYALVAPIENRLFDVRDTFFENPFVFESVNAFLLLALPLGVVLAWSRRRNRLGVAFICSWALLVALLSMEFLYAMTIAVIATTLGNDDIPAPD